MNEEQIANKLKQNIPAVVEPTTAPVVDVPDTTNGQATIAPDYPLDEITQYKLHDYFGVQYKPNDAEAKGQVQYIYEAVAKTLEDPQYGFVLAKIRELEQIIGTAHDERRLYKLYQWLKLDSVRKNIEAEQGALTNG